MRLLTLSGLLLMLFSIVNSWPATSFSGEPEKPATLPPQQERWDGAYRGSRRAPWDIGRPSTDLKQAVETGTLRPCRAVELGCGSGNDAIFLASRGFDITAIDIAPTALSLAKKKAQDAGVKVNWVHADVLKLPKLEPFELIYDRGCYHAVRRDNATGYVETLRRLSRPGTQVLILAGNANEPPPYYGPPRVREADIRADFEPWFEFQWLRETHFDTAEPSGKGALAWSILLRRKATGSASDTKTIRNYSLWKDTAGKLISCHDGGITRVGDTFYWYGTSYKGNPKGVWGRKGANLQNGFNCYSSKNLVDWKYEGVCFAFPKEGWLAKGTSHRPNVVYSDKTSKYVLWFFCIGTTEPEYPAAMLAVAVADKPVGPFRFLGQRNTAEEHGWGQDLGLFKDQDGKGYLVYDDGRRNIRVDLLADDFLSTSGKTCIALKSDGRAKRYEGAALIRYKGKYMAAGSGVQGWNPTDTSCAVADAPLGPYREMGLMSKQKTWKSQISNFVYIAESDKVLVMCDQWFSGPQGERVPIDESCQLWLPVTFDPATGVAQMQHVRAWNPWE